MPPGPERNVLPLLRWLRRGGARFPRLALAHRSSTDSAVHALTSIAPGDVVLRVPRTHILTQDLVLASPAGRRIAALSPESEDTPTAAYLLQEKQRPRSFWKPYLDALPPAFPTVPLFFDDRELSYLRGSFLLDAIAERRRALLADHALLRDRVPGFEGVSAGDFIRARLAVITRVFGLVLDGDETRCLVPMADMLNHARPPDTAWAYDERAGAYVMTATAALPEGAEVHDSYGAKCNSRFLLNYGFTLEDNDADNEAVLEIGVPEDAPWAEAKERLLGLVAPGARRSFKVGPRGDHEVTRAMLSFLRVACASDREMALIGGTPGLHARQVAPLSAANEARVHEALGAACEARLARFETTAAEDDLLLRDGAPSRNVRNCIVMRRGEKRVLGALVDAGRAALPLLRLPPAEQARFAAGPEAERPGAFLRESVLPALRADPWVSLERSAHLGHRLDRVPSHAPR
jgi:histone-lysine N-methyltransferase SETD3